MIKQAFILGAGLGTRLRPLTNILPKPLVPLYHKSLAEWAMDACEKVGSERFAINTHHLPEKWHGFGAEKNLELFHEPILLETGGGLKNLEAWWKEGSLLVHNGDIFSSIDLSQLVEAHEGSDDEVTLLLRSSGGAKKISVGEKRRIVDIRSEVQGLPGTHVFSGIYCVRPEILKRIPKGEPISVIPAFQELVREGKIGGVVIDDGEWMDLGDEKSYLDAHKHLALGPRVHDSAQLGAGASVPGSVIGAAAVIGANAQLTDCVVWPGVAVEAGCIAERRVFTE